jgi:hypothetical protein
LLLIKLYSPNIIRSPKDNHNISERFTLLWALIINQAQEKAAFDPVNVVIGNINLFADTLDQPNPMKVAYEGSISA